jgi:fructose-1,6-bisphosphatase/inositol monophosphatase family enzyme
VTHDLEWLLSLAVRAAAEASRLVGSKRGTGFKVERKEGADTLAAEVVTEVDRAAEALIRTHLMPTIGSGKLGFLGEESADDKSRLRCEAFWCIDPIDGTLSFVRGSPGFSTSIALVARDGSPLIGVVADPLSGNLWAAARGLGVTRNGTAFAASTTTSVFNLFADASFKDHPRFEECLQAMDRIGQALKLGPVVTHIGAGAVLNAISVLENGPACYFKFRRPTGGGSLWDYAATACIYAELERPAADLDGRPFDLNRADATNMTHRGIVYASAEEIATAVRAEFA